MTQPRASGPKQYTPRHRPECVLLPQRSLANFVHVLLREAHDVGTLVKNDPDPFLKYLSISPAPSLSGKTLAVSFDVWNAISLCLLMSTSST